MTLSLIRASAALRISRPSGLRGNVSSHVRRLSAQSNHSVNARNFPTPRGWDKRVRDLVDPSSLSPASSLSCPWARCGRLYPPWPPLGVSACTRFWLAKPEMTSPCRQQYVAAGHGRTEIDRASRLAAYPAVSALFASPSTTGTRFAARKSTNTRSLGARCRLDGQMTRRGPERSV